MERNKDIIFYNNALNSAPVLRESSEPLVEQDPITGKYCPHGGHIRAADRGKQAGRPQSSCCGTTSPFLTAVAKIGATIHPRRRINFRFFAEIFF
jgi:hypothetical protein